MKLHLGVIPALRLINANEYDIARMMAIGELDSPQTYKNVTLFKLRITGTAMAYRPKLNEYAYRLPENYLTDEFVARCNGLTVVMLHPKENILNSDEYISRNVGSVMLPYIQGDEVWAIAKIYYDPVIELLKNKQMSTSPAVLLEKSIGWNLPDGSSFIVEGEPSLLDHVAICTRGVWDLGGEPSGVESSLVEIKVDSDEQRVDSIEVHQEIIKQTDFSKMNRYVKATRLRIACM